MPERRIPWRQVANRFSGSLSVRTVLRASEFDMDLRHEGVHVRVFGNSKPYSMTGGYTEISARTRMLPASVLTVLRDVGEVPMFRRFLRRDILIGSRLFDVMWMINGGREATAQAYLGHKERRLIDAIPPMDGNGYGPWYYDFDIRRSKVVAHSIGFERDPERMAAAIEAVVALANRTDTLKEEWEQLSRALDGTLHMKTFWSMDGSTRITFAHDGSRMQVSPVVAKSGWRRERLVTRMTCDHSSWDGRRSFSSMEIDDDWKLLPQKAREAFADAKVREVHGGRSSLSVDLDGNVTDADRLRIAATGLLHVAGINQGLQGPYR